MSEVLSDLVVKIGLDSKRFNDGLRDMKKSVGDMTDEIASLSQKAALSFAAFGVGMTALGASVVKTAANFQALEYQLTNVYKSAEKAKDTMSFIKNLAVASPFEVKELTEAAVKLEVLGNNAKEFLPIAQDLASYMGTDVVEATQAFSRALSGSPEGFQSLREGYGITAQKLAEFGAVLNKQGGLVLDSTENIKKAGDALKEYVITNMGGASAKFAETFQGRISTLQDSITALKASLGEGLIGPVTGVVVKLTDMANAFNNLSQNTKNFISTSGIIATGLAFTAAGFSALVAPVLKAVAAIKESTLVTNALKGAMSGLANVLKVALPALVSFPAALVAIVIAAGLAIAKLQNMWYEVGKLNYELEKQKNNEVAASNRMIGIFDAYDLWGKSISEVTKVLKENNITTENLITAQIGLQTQYAVAMATGNNAEAERINKIRQLLHSIAPEMKTQQQKTQEEMLDFGKQAEDQAAQIEHNLKMGVTNTENAVNQYADVVTKARIKLGELTQGTEEYKKAQDELFKYEERWKALGGQTIIPEYKQYPGLPGSSYPQGQVKTSTAISGSSSSAVTTAASIIASGAAAATTQAIKDEMQTVAKSAGNTSTALDNLKTAADSSAQAIKKPSGDTFKQLSGFGTGTGGVFPSMSGFSNWIGVPDINIPDIDINPSKNPNRNLWKELSKPNYGLLSPDAVTNPNAYIDQLTGAMSPNVSLPSNQANSAKIEMSGAASEFRAGVREFAQAVKNINVKVDVKASGQSSVSAGQAAVAAAAQTNVDPAAASGLNAMPSIANSQTISGYGNS